MIDTTVDVINKLGLHARASGKLIEVTTKFKSTIQIGKGEKLVDAKNILSSTKDKVVEVSESEQFKQTVSAGKEFLQGTAGLVVDGFKYGKETLKDEYFRDLKANKPIHIPFNYFPDDDPEKEPILKWRSHANLLYRNWLNYVYQLTPFEIEEIGKIKEPIGTGSREDHGYAKTFTK